jgi:LAS superfamily LD-carboxypeptidase LdcB
MVTLPGAPAASAAPHSAVTAQAAAFSTGTTKTGTTTTPTTTGRVELEPTAADLAQQKAQLAQLRAQEKTQSLAVDDAQGALRASAALAGQALEEYATAARTLHDRQLVEQAAETTMEQAHAVADTHRRELGKWARQAYQGGTGLASDATLNMIFQARDSDDLGTDLVVLRHVGRSRSRALVAVQNAEKAASAATDRAADASQAAADAAIAAADARDTADQALDGQRRLLGIAETALAQTRTDTTAVQQQLAAAALAQARRADAVSNSGANKDNRVTGAVGSCTGGAVEQYPNGQIPIAALCPIWGATGYLRADAAYAYDRLSHAYADRFGTPVCLTDSYRSYASQVDLYARKPSLAAVPGTSNHGWGTAVDLCGGIENFGTVQHEWMLLNAPLYGWFHPSWAEPTGSRPEPWHWEFAG